MFEKGKSYRKQETLWRILALIQIPVTAAAIFAALIMYVRADTIMQVPEPPPLGSSDFQQLSDPQFVNVATQFVNLAYTYQPAIAREQFEAARKLLSGAALQQFDQQFDAELKTIEKSGRSQLFLVEPRQIDAERSENKNIVIVRLPGLQQQFVSQRALPPEEIVYYLDMTTADEAFPGSYGITVTDIRSRVVALNVIAEEDRKKAESQAATGKDAKSKKKKKKGKAIIH
jgi:hypothetical protein